MSIKFYVYIIFKRFNLLPYQGCHKLCPHENSLLKVIIIILLLIIIKMRHSGGALSTNLTSFLSPTLLCSLSSFFYFLKYAVILMNLNLIYNAYRYCQHVDVFIMQHIESQSRDGWWWCWWSFSYDNIILKIIKRYFLTHEECRLFKLGSPTCMLHMTMMKKATVNLFHSVFYIFLVSHSLPLIFIPWKHEIFSCC